MSKITYRVLVTSARGPHHCQSRLCKKLLPEKSACGHKAHPVERVAHVDDESRQSKKALLLRSFFSLSLRKAHSSQRAFLPASLPVHALNFTPTLFQFYLFLLFFTENSTQGNKRTKQKTNIIFKKMVEGKKTKAKKHKKNCLMTDLKLSIHSTINKETERDALQLEVGDLFLVHPSFLLFSLSLDIRAGRCHFMATSFAGNVDTRASSIIICVRFCCRVGHGQDSVHSVFVGRARGVLSFAAFGPAVASVRAVDPLATVNAFCRRGRLRQHEHISLDAHVVTMDIAADGGERRRHGFAEGVGGVDGGKSCLIDFTADGGAIGCNAVRAVRAAFLSA